MLPILLTASVDTRGMKGAKFSAEERERMYVSTLNYYVDGLSRREGEYQLVFVENSGWQKERIMRQLHRGDNVSVEYLALNPTLFPTEKGKSYNEMLLIDMATERSENVQKAGRFFKVTGRFPILNLGKLLSETINRGGKSTILL